MVAFRSRCSCRDAEVSVGAAALAGACVAAALLVHVHPRAGFGAHAAVKSAAALACCLVALTAVRAPTVSREVAAFGASQLLCAFTGMLAGEGTKGIALALASPLLLVLGSMLASDPDRRHWAVRAIVVATVLASLLAMLEIYVLELPWAHARRPQSTFANRNFLAHWLAATVPLLLVARRGLLAEGGRLVAVVVVALVLAVTRCRAAWLALGMVGITALAHCLHATPRRAPAAWVRSALALLIGAALAALPTRLAFHVGVSQAAARVLSVSEGADHGRLAQMRACIELGLSRPLFGWGLGGWPRRLALSPTVRNMLADGGGRTPNSDVARSFVEGGFVGLASTLALVAAGAVAYVRWLRGSRGQVAPSQDDGALMASAAILGLIAFVDAPLFRPESSLLLGVALAAGAANRSRVSVPTWAVGALTLACCVYAVIESLPP